MRLDVRPSTVTRHAYASMINLNLSAKRSGSHQANMSAKWATAGKGSGLLRWFSSLLPRVELAPVQASKKGVSLPNII